MLTALHLALAVSMRLDQCTHCAPGHQPLMWPLASSPAVRLDQRTHCAHRHRTCSLNVARPNALTALLGINL